MKSGVGRNSGGSRGLNSPAGPVLDSAWSGLRDAVHASPWPAGSPAFWARAWLAGLAGGPGKRGRSHDPLTILGGEFPGFRLTKPLLEALGIHHNRYKTVLTLQSTGNIRRTRSSKNSVNRRRDGGTVNEIRWVFPVLWVGSNFLLLGAFGRHHHNRQKIVYTRKAIEIIQKFC